MASGWNLWVWLVSVVRRYIINILIIIITFPYSTCISSFWQHHPYVIVKFLKCFFFIVYTVYIAISIIIKLLYF